VRYINLRIKKIESNKYLKIKLKNNINDVLLYILSVLKWVSL